MGKCYSHTDKANVNSLQRQMFIWNICILDCSHESWGSVVGVVITLWTGWLRYYDLVPSMARDCAFLQNV